MAESTISEPMTWKQICERYPDQWVALVEDERWLERRRVNVLVPQTKGSFND